MQTLRRPAKPRPESEIREDLRQQLEAIVRGFDASVAADDDAESDRYFKNWPLKQ